MLEILNTDFYQASMVFAYGCLGEANKQVGFEAFVRRIKPEVAGDKGHYIFSGEDEIAIFMEKVRVEVKNPLLPYIIAGLIEGKIKNNPNKDELIQTFLRNAKNFDTDFTYSVYPEGGKLYAYTPAFQFKGPIWIGQLIETYVCNIINGKTGFQSAKDHLSVADYLLCEAAVFGDEEFYIDSAKYNPNMWNVYSRNLNEIKEKAKEYREATSKILLEAAFRRAPSIIYAKDVSRIALSKGWNGTSNLAAFFGDLCELINVNGTMAHSFVMSHRYEIEAYVKWNKIFPNSTILVDTYDTIEAVQFLIDAGIKPAVVRIDSDPLDEYAFKVRNILNLAGWNDVKIFLSGDLTPEILRDYENRKVPFDMCMAGTKYANINGLEKINSGFVYKIVEVHDEKGIFYPEKKASGKKNYPGLKSLTIGGDKVTIASDWNDFGIHFSTSDLEKTNGATFEYPEIVQ